MTDDEIIEGLMEGSLDTHRWEDALAIARHGLEDEETTIFGAWDAGTHWLFDTCESRDRDEIRWGSGWPSPHPEPTSIYSLEKGNILLVMLLANDDLLAHEWPGVSMPDFA